MRKLLFVTICMLVFSVALASAASVSFVSPTPADGSIISSNSTYVNVSSVDTNTHYTLLDWNSSLVGWWRLENGNGTFFADDSGRNNGTCSNCPTFNSSGAFNGSYQFDGVSKYITIGDRADLNITNQSFSYCFWTNLRSSQIANFYPAGKGAASAISPYGFWFASSGKAVKMLVGGSGCAAWLQSTSMTGTWEADVWQHWCFVKSGNSTYMYKNGTQVGSYTMASNSICANNNQFTIGAGHVGSAAGYINGSVDEVVFFRRALDLQEVRALYNASANQYSNNFTNLSIGGYSFKAYAVDSLGNKNSTEMRTINVSGGSVLSATLSSPADNYATSTFTSTNITFQCSATDISALTNISLFITNSSNQSFALNRTTSVTGMSNSSSWVLDLTPGNYTWNCRAGNSSSYAFAPANRSLRIDYSPDMIYPIFSGYWDNNATLSVSGRGLFNVTVTNTNGTVYLNINGQHIRATNLSANMYNASYDFSSAGTYVYNWTAYGNGTMNNLNSTSTFYYLVHSLNIISLYQYPQSVFAGRSVYSYCIANSTKNASSQLNVTTAYKNNASSSWQSSASNYLRRRTIWSIGDSITRGSPNYNPSLPAGPSNPVNSSYQYWLDYYMNSNASGLDGSGVSIYNKGTGSDTCLGMANRFNTDIGNNSIVVLMCGINDFSLGRNYTQAADSVNTIYSKAVAKNDTLIILEVIPDGNGMFCANITPFNAWLNSNFAGNPNVTVVATHSIMSSGTYCYYNSTLYVEGVHPNVLGHQVIARAVWNALNRQYYESWASSTTISLGENVSSYDFSCNVSDGIVSSYQANYRSVNVSNAPDVTPPSSVSNLDNKSTDRTWIYWNWTNPSDSDFSQAIVYINSANVANISNNYYNATGLACNSEYTITVRTKDTSGNVNSTDINDSALTSPCNNDPGVTTPSVAPVTAYTNSDLNCTFIVTDSDAGDSLSVNYTWYNGTTSVITGAISVINGTENVLVLGSGNTTKGETWNCSIIPYDGHYYGVEKSSTRTISNSLPTAPVVDILPGIPGDNEDLALTIPTPSSDLDNDPITYSYQWYKNDILQAGQTSNTLSKLLTSIGENWKCVVTPNDGSGNGATAQDNVTIVSSDTTAPMITINNPANGGSLSSGTTSITINITTNENASCRYGENSSTFDFASGNAFNSSDYLSHSFVKDGLSDGQTYTFYYKCNDSSGNVNSNSAAHSFSVATALYCGDAVCNNGETCSTCSADCGGCSSGGGGGGGGSRFVVKNVTVIPVVNTSAGQVIEFGVPELEIEPVSSIIANPGESKKMSVNVRNSGTGYLNKCVIAGSGDIASWITADGAADLSIGQRTEFLFSLDVPKDVQAGNYEAGFSIICQEIAKNSSVSVEIIPKKLALKMISANRLEDGGLKIIYSLGELAGEAQEVDVQIVLIGSKGLRVAELNEKRVIQANSEETFETTLGLSKDVEEGNLNLVINANSKLASAFVQEYVLLERISMSGFNVLDNIGGGSIVSAAAVIAFLVFSFFVVRRILRYRGMDKRKDILSVMVGGIMHQKRSFENRAHNHSE